MSITRAQKARQMYKRGTFGGSNKAQGPAGGASAGGNYGGNRNPSQDYGGGGGDRDDRREQYSVASTTGTSPKSITAPVDKTGPGSAQQRVIDMLGDFKKERPEVNVPGLFGTMFRRPIQKFADFTAGKNRPFFEEVIRAGKIPGLNFATVANMTPEELEQQYDNYMSARLSGEIDAFGNPLNQGDDSSPLLRTGIMTQAPKEDEEEDPFFPNFRLMAEGGRAGFQEGGGKDMGQVIGETFLPSDEFLPKDYPLQFRKFMNELKFRNKRKQEEQLLEMFEKYMEGQKTPMLEAKGGGLADIARQELVFGGVADAIGKGLKKATRAIKKIAKSPIGKAALLYGGFKGFQALGGGKGIMAKLFGQAAAGTKAMPGVGPLFKPATEGLLGKLGLTKGGGSLMPTAFGGIFLPSLIAGATTKKDDETKTTDFGPDIDDPELIMKYPELYYNMRQFAEGGSTDKEPVAKKTMPLLDMGGMEKDYRAEGGFVPIGRMEKADDVPARLSKNEFVFTADAVRNAGDGDVDKGAEVMYNMMKNLEAGGEVSEESQGLEGARKMFQTSQRLEEVL